jgi:hypothetical protein
MGDRAIAVFVRGVEGLILERTTGDVEVIGLRTSVTKKENVT